MFLDVNHPPVNCKQLVTYLLLGSEYRRYLLEFTVRKTLRWYEELDDF